MEVVFIVIHKYTMPSGCDEGKIIGVYTSKEEGKIAVSKVIEQPGFKDYPNCFYINEHTIDKTHWEEGFIETDSDDIQVRLN